MLGLTFGVGLRLKTNLVPTATGTPSNPWEIILKKVPGDFFMHIIYNTLGVLKVVKGTSDA